MYICLMIDDAIVLLCDVLFEPLWHVRVMVFPQLPLVFFIHRDDISTGLHLLAGYILSFPGCLPWCNNKLPAVPSPVLAPQTHPAASVHLYHPALSCKTILRDIC